MADIGEIAKKLAAKIAYQLNQKDSNPNDNFIDANIWEEYAVTRYGVNNNTKTKKISIFNAEQSIEKTLNTQSQASGKPITEIGNQWYSDLVNIKEKPKSKQTFHAEYTPHTEQNDATVSAAVNIPEAKTIRKGKRPTIKQILNIKSRTFGDCKESSEIHIKQELNRRKLTKTDAKIEYWSEKIGYMAYKYGIPEEILVAIIGRENKFEENKSNGRGSGAMALTTIAIEDMFPNKHWSETYAMLDEKLHSDIFYKNSKLQYRNSASVRKACRNDDLSIQVGTLCFEMCYVKALTAKLRHKAYEKVTEPEVQDTIAKLKSEQIDFSKINNEEVVATALSQYNGHPVHMNNYKNDTMKSLRAQGFDFKKKSILRT